MDETVDSELADLNSHTIEGIARHSGRYFSVPLFSQVADNLWMGGCPRAAAPRFDTIVDLYCGERYPIRPTQIHVRCAMLDSRDLPSPSLLDAVVEIIGVGVERGPTLVHCQAGLNRSGLLTALALIKLADMTPADAIAHLRESRRDAVLCNDVFERYLLSLQ